MRRDGISPEDLALAENNYALMLSKCEGGPQDLEGARDYHHRAAEKGYTSAEYNYAVMLYRGEGGDKNPEEAISLLEGLACFGFVPAIAFLSDLEDKRTSKEKAETKEISIHLEESFLSGEESDLEDEPAAAGAGAGAAGAGAIKGVAKTVTIKTGLELSILCDDHSSLFAKLTPETLAFMDTTFGKDSTKRIVPYLFDDIIDIFERIQNYCLTSERKLVFKRKAKKDFAGLISNRKTRIYAEYTLDLIGQILTNPSGRPSGSEKLRGGSDYYSCRINNKHRLVYSLSEDQLEIIRCAEHYGRL
jgi:Txe/YoeB family toxin of toxin-antitoxin system